MKPDRANGRPEGTRGAGGKWGPLLTVAILSLMAVGAPTPAMGVEGFYVGFGPAAQTFSQELDGTQRFSSPSGAHEARMSDPASGNGFAVGGGYGFNPFIAFDLLVTVTRHSPESSDAGGPGPVFASNAQLSSVLAGVRLSLPLGEAVDLFGRIGMGGYELEVEDGLRQISNGAIAGDARFSGSGIAAGIGGEVFFGNVGVELSFIHHQVEFDTVNTTVFQGGISPPPSVGINAVSLLATYHFP